MTMLKALVAGVMAVALIGAPVAAQAPRAPSQPPAPRMGTKPQEMYLAKITVSDLNRSLDFYTNIIGLKLVTSPDMELPKPPKPGDPEKDFVEIALNYSGSMADPLFVLMKRRGKTLSADNAALVTIGFKVPSTKRTMDRAVQAGFKPMRPFGGEGQPGLLADPDGYTVELVQGRSFDGQ